MNDVVLTAHEVAKLLKVSRRHVDRLKREEGLPHIHLGKRVVFPREQVLEWLNHRVSRTSEKTQEATHG